MAKEKDSGIVNIHGKEYQTVALRVQTFREKFPTFSLETEIVFRDESEVVMKATISDESGRVLATGHSEEQRKSSQINRTSALENGETSAIGRALASLGLGGTEFASANEVQNAIKQQNSPVKKDVVFITEDQGADLDALIAEVGADAQKFCTYYKIDHVYQLPADKYHQAIKQLEAKRGEAK